MCKNKIDSSQIFSSVLYFKIPAILFKKEAWLLFKMFSVTSWVGGNTKRGEWYICATATRSANFLSLRKGLNCLSKTSTQVGLGSVLQMGRPSNTNQAQPIISTPWTQSDATRRWASYCNWSLKQPWWHHGSITHNTSRQYTKHTLRHTHAPGNQTQTSKRREKLVIWAIQISQKHFIIK